MKVSIMTIFVFTVVLASCNSNKSENTIQESSEIEASTGSASKEVNKQLTSSEKLLPIMSQLMVDMNRINEGVFMENYPMIDSAAYRIANHAEIDPNQKQIIKKNLGKSMEEFARIDKAVHDRAVSISKAAKQKNMGEILSEYHILQNSCVNCHNQFRDRLQSEFRER
ncbi:hypothetical protein [Salegentibacter sp. F14]